MRRVLQSLDLIASEPVDARQPDDRSARGKPQLWIAVCLPSLALECLPATPSTEPAVAVEAEQGQLYVVASSRAAADAGIVAGTKLSTAMALVASLQVFERALHLEQASLESLAEWAKRLTSMVSVESPEGVLLEVSGSLKLFGTLEAIKAKLEEELSRRYRDFRFCVAPTATAALWLARAASTDVLQWQQLTGRLGALPLGVTRWPSPVRALLRDLGIRTIGECVRLPREGFARRVGKAYLLELDRAFGRRFDLRAEFKVPDTWSSRVELFEESADSAMFVEGVEQLLDELIGELRKRQAQIGSLQIAFEHLHRPPTIESFDLLEPTHDRDRLLNLIKDRLERSALPVPAMALRVSSGVFRPLKLEEPGLFEAKPLEERVQALLERLQERFGSAAVYGLRAVAEHRPEKAWAKWSRLEGRPGGGDKQLPDRQARPLWLLPKPVPLSPLEAHRALLELCSGPERIESGWWDDQDVGRDYYTAQNAHGQRLWVFRDRRTHGWYLHGLFG